MPLLRIQPGGRLIDNEHPRIAGDSLRQAQPLAHAARIPCHLAGGGVGEVDPFQQFLGHLTAAAWPGDPFQFEQQLQHGQPGEIGVETEILRQVTQSLVHEARVLHDVVPVQHHLAGGGLDQASHHLHEGALASAVGTQQAEQALT